MPAGSGIYPASGVISGTLPLDDSDGDFDVTVTATDPGRLSVERRSSNSIADGYSSHPLQTPSPGQCTGPHQGLLTVDATNFDSGGQGISWNDDAGLLGGTQSRSDTDVELVGAEQDIGYVLAGEWVGYTSMCQGGYHTPCR